jgi:hypothetical protein
MDRERPVFEGLTLIAASSETERREADRGARPKRSDGPC